MALFSTTPNHEPVSIEADHERTRAGLDTGPDQHREDELEAGRVIIVREREAIFTGKRRPRIKRICACGCGEKFTTTFEDKLYKNKAHKQRKYKKKMTTRAARKSKKTK
jgi:hypothetical protein